MLEDGLCVGRWQFAVGGDREGILDLLPAALDLELIRDDAVRLQSSPAEVCSRSPEMQLVSSPVLPDRCRVFARRQDARREEDGGRLLRARYRKLRRGAKAASHGEPSAAATTGPSGLARRPRLADGEGPAGAARVAVQGGVGGQFRDTEDHVICCRAVVQEHSLAAEAPVVVAATEEAPGAGGLRLVLSGAYALRAMLDGRRAPAVSTLRTRVRKAWKLTHAGRYTELAGRTAEQPRP